MSSLVRCLLLFLKIYVLKIGGKEIAEENIKATEKKKFQYSKFERA